MIINYDYQTTKRMEGLAKNIIEFVEDRKYRWTYDLSCHKGGRGSDVIKTNKKRGMTRPLFYGTVGAGSPLDSVFLKYVLFYTSSTIGLSLKQIKGDHINPPQEFGEFYFDKVHGYFTEKDTNIIDIDVIVECLKFTMKKVEIAGPLNNSLSKYTPSSGKEPIITSEKYKYLNENVSLFKDELTLYTDGRLATDDELQFLFGGCPIDGYADWQMEKYGAKSFGYDFGDNKPNSIISLKNNSVGNLENFFE